MSLHNEAVAIRNASYIIEQVLIHRSEARRAMSGVRVLGEAAATPSPPAMGLGSAVSIPGGSRAKHSCQTDDIRSSA